VSQSHLQKKGWGSSSSKAFDVSVANRQKAKGKKSVY
jgi:hypothetical protein